MERNEEFKKYTQKDIDEADNELLKEFIKSCKESQELRDKLIKNGRKPNYEGAVYWEDYNSWILPSGIITDYKGVNGYLKE